MQLNKSKFDEKAFIKGACEIAVAQITLVRIMILKLKLKLILTIRKSRHSIQIKRLYIQY